MAEGGKKKDSDSGVLGRLAGRGEDALTRLMDELGRNPRVTEALDKALSAKGKVDETTRKTLGQVGLAAADELKDVRKQLERLEKRLASLEPSGGSSSSGGGSQGRKPATSTKSSGGTAKKTSAPSGTKSSGSRSGSSASKSGSGSSGSKSGSGSGSGSRSGSSSRSSGSSGSRSGQSRGSGSSGSS